MVISVRRFPLLVFAVAATSTFAFAQKVNVQYDKSIDFSQYKSYTLEQPDRQPSKPLLYVSVVSTIRNELEAKGLTSKDADGDLTVVLSGGLDYGLGGISLSPDYSCKNCQTPQQDTSEWPSKGGPKGAGGKPQPNGNLQVNMVDRLAKKTVWSGTVTQKLDADKKEKSLEKANEAVKKLMAEFPPAKK
jgi:hypothetical protein